MIQSSTNVDTLNLEIPKGDGAKSSCVHERDSGNKSGCMKSGAINNTPGRLAPLNEKDKPGCTSSNVNGVDPNHDRPEVSTKLPKQKCLRVGRVLPGFTKSRHDIVGLEREQP